MFREKKRYGQDPGVVVRSKPATFNLPLKIKEPTTFFVCSWSDFYVEEADAWRLEAWDIMRRCPQHYFLILTKRIERIIPLTRYTEKDFGLDVTRKAPWPNIGLGVTAENQEMAHERIMVLAEMNAAMKFVSYEPALKNIDWQEFLKPSISHPSSGNPTGIPLIDWVIAGAESLSNKAAGRPCDKLWFANTISECAEAGVPVFVKQMHWDGKSNSVMASWPLQYQVQQFPESLKRHFEKYAINGASRALCQSEVLR
jgi:protein gp37